MKNSKTSKGGIENFEKKVSQMLLFFIPTFIIIIYFIFKETDFKGLIGRINVNYLILLIALMLFAWLLNTIKFFFVVRLAKGRVTFNKAFEIVLAAIFGANITPFYTGGIATQTYFLTKFAETIGRSIAISVIFFILTLIVAVIFALILFFIPHGFVTGLRSGFIYGIAGIMVAYFFSQNKLLLLFIVILSILTQTVSILITPVSFLVLGIPFSFKEVFITQIAVQLTASMGFTPGGIGIIETAYAGMFYPFAKDSIALLTFISRLAYFYVPALVGLFFFSKLLREERFKSSSLKEVR
ncbi:MAG: lysylphosphatidylglycerol synthase transmembrane domain-containing protein [Caldiserica bacterium]|nr:lysylphosphatidylglycerol synthase transmembrane domain-containing protein [Caldisericota bacterium]